MSDYSVLMCYREALKAQPYGVFVLQFLDQWGYESQLELVNTMNQAGRVTLQ